MDRVLELHEASETNNRSDLFTEFERSHGDEYKPCSGFWLFRRGDASMFRHMRTRW